MSASRSARWITVIQPPGARRLSPRVDPVRERQILAEGGLAGAVAGRRAMSLAEVGGFSMT